MWIAAMIATGTILGLLLAYGTETAKSLFSVEQTIRYSCGKSWGSGQVVNQNDGASYCAHWIVTPAQAAARQ